MTVRKSDNRLAGDRTPAYVDQATGAAELCISVETWNRWVEEGRLPRPAPGFPPSTPRWRWADVDPKLAGKLQPVAGSDPYVTGARGVASGAQKERRRDAA